MPRMEEVADDERVLMSQSPSATRQERTTDLQRPSAWRAFATVAAATVIVAALAAIVRWQDDEREPSEAVSPPTSQLSAASLSEHGADFVGVSAPPLLVMSAAGWTLSSIDDSTPRHQLFVAVDSVTGFAGSAFVVGRSELNVADGGRPGVPGSESLIEKGIDGSIIGADGERTIEWRVDNQLLSAQARNLRDADALAIVKSLSITPDGTVAVANLPAGMVKLAPAEFAGLSRYVTYGWINDDESKTMEATLGGAENIGPSIPGQDLLEPIAFGDRTAYFSNVGVMRVSWLDGFWHWTLSGTGYAERDAFIDDALTVTSTDRATWENHVAGHAITPSERPAAVAEILADIPAPPGFDPRPIASEDVAQSRFQLITRVTSAVWCGWASLWDEALSAGNNDLAATASTALASSVDWDALVETADEGGWADSLWDASARVADGDRTVWASMKSGFNCAVS